MPNIFILAVLICILHQVRVSLQYCYSYNCSALEAQYFDGFNSDLNCSSLDNLGLQQMNSIFINFLSNLPTDYQHNQQDYLIAHCIIRLIKKNVVINQQRLEEVILLLGKTGWGKSTVANLLEGVQFIVTEDGTFQPRDRSHLITEIGTGTGSTTLTPKLLHTKFGTAYDLPGDQQTRGIFMEMINAITKMYIAKTSRSMKLLLTVPERVFTAEGSYGGQLKKYMESLDKFLGGVNRFKDNIIFIITFAKRRKNQLMIIQNNVRALLNHEDRQLQKYAGLFETLIEQKRIKIIAESDWNVETYSQPVEWTEQSFSAINQQIRNLKSRQVNEEEFSLPYNLVLIKKLHQFMKVLKQKIKYQFNAKFEHLNITGLELTTVKKIMKDIRKSKNMGVRQFVKIFRKNDYFNTESIHAVIEEMQFIHKFQTHFERESAELKTDWVSTELDAKLTEALEEVAKMCTFELKNFKTRAEGYLVAVRPNYDKYEEISAEYDKFQKLSKYYDDLLNQQSNENSVFYEELTEKILIEVLKEPVEIEESYIEFVEEVKTRKVLKLEKSEVPTKKYREVWKEVEWQDMITVPKVRKVPKKKQVVHEYQGERRFLFFGPRQKIIKQTTIEYETEEIYLEVANKTQKKLVPHRQQYEEYDTITVQVDEQYTEEVPVQRKRSKTVWKQNQIFEVRTRRVFNTTRLALEQSMVQSQIRAQVQAIKSIIGDKDMSTPEQLLKEMQKYSHLMMVHNVTMSETVFNFFDVNFKWWLQAYESFSAANPTKELEGLPSKNNTSISEL